MMRSRLVSLVAAAMVGAGVVAAVLPVTPTSAGASACGLPSAKCVAIVAPFPSQDLLGGVVNQTITYTFQVDPAAPGKGLGSGSIQPTAGSGITFTRVTSSVTGADCFVSSAGAATCLDLNQRAGSTFTVQVTVNVTCSAGGDTFSTLWSGASDFRNNPNGRGDQFLLDTSSTQYLQQVVTEGCALSFVSEPATTTTGTGISSLVDAPATTNPVEVQLQTGAGPVAGAQVTIALGTGGPVGAVLSGTTTQTTDNDGIASFPGISSTALSINVVGTYQLVASSDGYVPATSSPFDVGDALTSCASGATCSTSGSSGGTSYTVQYTNTSGQTEVLTSGLGTQTYGCGTYTPSSDSLTTAVYFASTGAQDPNAVTTNDVTDTTGTFANTDRICYGSGTPIPPGSVAPGYNCDPNTIGNSCRTTFDGLPEYFAVLNTCFSNLAGATVGNLPHGVAFDPTDDTVYVANTNDGTVSAINASSDALLATIAVGGSPQGLAFDSADDSVYVANEGSFTVSVIDAATNTVTTTIPITGSANPEQVGVDASTHTVYVSLNAGSLSPGSVATIDDRSNTVTGTVTVGIAPYGVAVDVTTDTIYVANDHSSNVSVINGANDNVTTIPLGGPNPDTGSGPFGIGVDEATDTVYVAVDDQSSVAVINGRTSSVTVSIPLDGTPYGLAVDQATGTVYVAVNSSNEVAVIDGASNALAGTIFQGSSAGPFGVAVNPSTGVAYVSDAGDGTLSALTFAGDPCANFDLPVNSDNFAAGVRFSWQSVGDPIGRDV